MADLTAALARIRAAGRFQTPAGVPRLDFDPDQARDENGRWTDEPGGLRVYEHASDARSGVSRRAEPLASLKGIGEQDPQRFLDDHEEQARWVRKLKGAGEDGPGGADGYYHLQAYIEGESDFINGDLRTNGKGLDKEAVDTLTAVLDEAPPIEEGTVVWRGFEHPELASDPKAFLAKNSGVFYDKAFVSTSVDLAVARRFALGFTAKDGVLFKIRLPAGTRAAYITTFKEGAEGVARGGENELLLQRDAGFRITGYSRSHDGYLIVEADYLGSEPRGIPEKPGRGTRRDAVVDRTARFGWRRDDVVWGERG